MAALSMYTSAVAAIGARVDLLRGTSGRSAERGAAMTEYGLLLFLIAISAVAALAFFGDEVVALFDSAGTELDALDDPAAP